MATGASIGEVGASLQQSQTTHAARAIGRPGTAGEGGSFAERLASSAQTAGPTEAAAKRQDDEPSNLGEGPKSAMGMSDSTKLGSKTNRSGVVPPVRASLLPAMILTQTAAVQQKSGVAGGDPKTSGPSKKANGSEPESDKPAAVSGVPVVQACMFAAPVHVGMSGRGIAAGVGGKILAGRGREGMAAGAASATGSSNGLSAAKGSEDLLGAVPAVQAEVEAGGFGRAVTAAAALGPNAVISPSAEGVIGVAGGSLKGNVVGHGAGAAHEGVEGEGVSGTSWGAVGLSEPRTLVASPNVLEVGITGGAHGWLRVRAELEHTGQVTASLVASSAGSADSLHKQLGAISDYLKSESVGVTSLAITGPEKSGSTQGFAGAGFGGLGGGGGTAGRHGEGTGRPSVLDVLEADRAEPGPGYGFGVPAAVLGGGSGSWLSVRV
jgi:hypothetical protein